MATSAKTKLYVLIVTMFSVEQCRYYNVLSDKQQAGTRLAIQSLPCLTAEEFLLAQDNSYCKN